MEHLSLPGAVVNNPSPWREGPANEVDRMPLHCVTHWGWLAGRSSPGHWSSLCYRGSYCNGADRFMNKRHRAIYIYIFLPPLTFTLALHEAEIALNAVIREIPLIELGCRWCRQIIEASPAYGGPPFLMCAALSSWCLCATTLFPSLENEVNRIQKTSGLIESPLGFDNDLRFWGVIRISWKWKDICHAEEKD